MAPTSTPTTWLRWSSAALLAIALAGCGAPSASAPTSVEAPAATAAATSTAADLAPVKDYLVERSGELSSATAALKTHSDAYYALAKQANFDYAALWSTNRAAVIAVIQDARAAWVVASPGYERIEGIVAGVPSLAAFDVVIDAGTSGTDGGENVAPVDLALPNGRMLAKPGNLFGVTESTLWGTFPEYTIKQVQADFDADGSIGFGEALPDANVLKAGVDTLHEQTVALGAAAQAWQPTEQDAFTALVTMVPTMTEYFNSWKSSRFVAGGSSTQRDFVAISRLADIQDILGSLQVVHRGVSAVISQVDPAQDAQIGQGLSELKAFVADVYAKERRGERFTAEDADLLGSEAQSRADTITGHVTQAAAKLNIALQ